MQKFTGIGYKRLVIAVLSVSLISGAVIAKGFGMGKTEHRMAHVSQHLELDEDQQLQLQSLLKARQDDQKQQRRLRQQLRELVSAQTLDVAQMEQVAASIAGNAEAAIIERSLQLHQFQLSLNQTQKEKWKTMEQRRQQHRPAPF